MEMGLEEILLAMDHSRWNESTKRPGHSVIKRIKVIGFVDIRFKWGF